MLHLMHFCSDMTEDTTTQFFKIVLFIYLANIKYLCHRRQFAHLQTEYTIFDNFLSDGVLTIHIANAIVHIHLFLHVSWCRARVSLYLLVHVYV